jgi:hypothetical protein
VPPPERRATDTPRSYASLTAYCELGPTRSLEKLVQIWTRSGLEKPPTKWLSTLKRWSTDGSWVERSNEWDRAVAAAEDAARAEIRAARRIELENVDWDQGKALREVVGAILLEMPKFKRDSVQRIERVDPLTKVVTITEVITLAIKAGPGELARAMELASKLQRLSVGEATEIHKLVESELGAMLDRLRDNLPPEDYARIVAVIAGEAAA